MSPLFPWPSHREPWALEVESFMADGRFREDLLDPERRRIHVHEGGDWGGSVLRVLAYPDDERDDVVPDRVHVLVNASRTQTRIPVELQNEGTAWAGDVVLRRELLGGVVTLVAEATSVIDDRVRLVGRSEEWRLVVDPGAAPVPAGAPPFEMVWVDFSAGDAPEIARRSPDSHAVMDLSGNPTLYLNEAVEGFRALLHADTARGERRRARDLLGADAARVALTTLLRAAVEDVEMNASEDAAPPPEDPLLRQTLEAVARVNLVAGDLEDLCDRIAGADSLTARLSLWSELDAAVGRLCGYPDAVASVAKEARNV